MSTLNDNDVKKVAELAHLELSTSEIAKYKKELSEIINFVSQLDEVDTSNTEPTSQTTGLTNIYRADVVDQSRILSQDEALSGSDRTHNGLPRVKAGYFVVPMILVNKENK